jgi:hypothetical protein
MPRWKPNYKEGDWIALPLIRRGGWGLGLIARCKAPAIIGYFFGPRRSSPPTMADTAGLRREDAVTVVDVGDLGFRKGEWLVVGSHPNWDRADWPMPLFTTQDGPRLYLSTYDEEDPSQLFHRERTTQEEADRRGAIERSVFGYAALSLKLDKLLAERETQSAA